MDKVKEKALQDYLDFKRISVKTENKIKDIERYVGRFLDSSKKPLSKFTEKELIDYVISLEDFSKWTQNDIKVYLKVFIEWYWKDYSLRFRNFKRILKTSTPIKDPKNLLTLEEINKMIEAEKDLMWKTYIAVFTYGGFRPSEACTLTFDKIDFDNALIKVKTTKTGKTFFKDLNPLTINLLKEWRDKNDLDLIFPSPYNENKPIGAKAVYHRIKNLSKRVLGKSVSPYFLRHSLADFQYNREDLSDEQAANQMGHSKIMKGVYTHFNEDRAKAKAKNVYSKKPLTHEEKNKVEELEEQIKEMKEAMKEQLILNQETRRIFKMLREKKMEIKSQ